MTDDRTGLQPLRRQLTIDRRELMRLSAATGLSLSALPWLGSGVRAATPKRGGHARLAIHAGNTIDSFDPEVTPSAFITSVRCAVLDNLTEINAQGELEGNLAESWEASDGARRWRFRLRQGVTFSNGKSVTPEDVVNSFRLHMGETKSPMKVYMDEVEEISGDGNDVVFQLTQANADWATLVAEHMFSILPTKDGKADWTSQIGSGTYIVEEFDPGVSIKLRRNPNHHRDSRGHFDSAEAIVVNDTSARVSAIQTGSVDGISQVDPRFADRLAGNSGIRIVERNSPGFYCYDMLVTDERLAKNDIRLALKFGIDREEFVQKILNGHGSIGNDQPLGKTYRFAAMDIPQRTYDPDKSKFHLKRAGLESIDLTIHAADAAFAGAVDGAVLYQEAAKRGGVNLQVVSEPSDGYWSNVWGKKPVFAGFWSGRASEYHLLSLVYKSGAGWNAAAYAEERFDMAIEAAKSELDDAKRRQHFHDAQMILHDEGPSVIPAFFNTLDAVSAKIGTPDTDIALAGFEGRYAINRWWFN